MVDKIQSKSNYLNSLEKARMSYRMFHDFLVLAGKGRSLLLEFLDCEYKTYQLCSVCVCDPCN